MMTPTFLLEYLLPSNLTPWGLKLVSFQCRNFNRLKWNNQHVTSVWQRKNLSPRQDSNLSPPNHRAGALSAWATENSWRVRPYTTFIVDMHPAYCLGQQCQCCTDDERMKDSKFWARWNKCENEIISVSRAWDKEKIWVLERIRAHDLRSQLWSGNCPLHLIG